MPAAPAAASPAAGRAHVADFVEEHGPVVGELGLARACADRAGEGALLEPGPLRLRDSVGSAAQFASTTASGRRSDRTCSARATSSLPVPHSPRIGCVTMSVGHTLDQDARGVSHPLAVAEGVAWRRPAPSAAGGLRDFIGSDWRCFEALPQPAARLVVEQLATNRSRRASSPARWCWCEPVAEMTITGTSLSIFLNRPARPARPCLPHHRA